MCTRLRRERERPSVSKPGPRFALVAGTLMITHLSLVLLAKFYYKLTKKGLPKELFQTAGRI